MIPKTMMTYCNFITNATNKWTIGKGLEPKFVAVSKDEKYSNLPLLFAQMTVQDSKDYIKSLGILALPSVQIYTGTDGLVENFPCGPSKIPILKKKIAQVVNSNVDSNTLQLKLV